MTTIINGSSPSVTFSDSTTQTTAFTTGSVTQSMVSTSTANGFGLCRAWVNFYGGNGNNNASYNVSSITRNGAGNYNVNFTTALTDNLYAAIGTASVYGSTSSFYVVVTTGDVAGNFGTKTSSTCAISCNPAGGVGEDPNNVSVAFFR